MPKHSASCGQQVLHLSAVDHGGAGAAALRLHQAMLQRGISSHMFVWESLTGVSNIEQANLFGLGALRRFAGRTWFRLRSRRRYIFRDQLASCVSPRKLVDLVKRTRPTLIIVHYISDFITFEDVALLQKVSGARVVFHLLDMGLLTGGCHYSWGCRAYRDQCGNCPALPGRPTGRDASERTMQAKIEVTSGLDHVLVAPSSQLAKDAEGASVFLKSQLKPVLIGVDPSRFGAETQQSARNALGISLNRLTLLFGAQQLNDRRKGMTLLLQALQQLASAGILEASRAQLLVVGRKGQLGSLDDIGVPVIELGLLNEDELARTYCAADLFICPSIEDSGPMMVNEAIMSGTPVVGFPIGVLPDLVIEGETGFLASGLDAKALAKAIALAIPWCSKDKDHIRGRCRDRAMAMCSFDAQVDAFIELANESE